MVGYFPLRMVGQILEDVKLGLTIMDMEGQVVWYNKRAQKLLGWHDRMEKNNVLDCHDEASHPKVLEKVGQVGSGEWHSILELNGRFIENIFSSALIPGLFTGVVIVSSDVTQREQMLEIIKKAAVTDELTGLYNRKYFEQIFNDLCDTKEPFGAIMLDVNALKYVNDNFGHAAGDKLIIEAAELIKNSVRKADYVFRYLDTAATSLWCWLKGMTPKWWKP